MIGSSQEEDVYNFRPLDSPVPVTYPHSMTYLPCSFFCNNNKADTIIGITVKCELVSVAPRSECLSL